MPSTYSPLKIELIATGEQSGTWGNTTNTNLGTALEEAITGSADVTFSSGNVTVTLTDVNTTQTARNLRLNLTGTTGGARDLILGSGCQIEKLYLVNNGCADAITVKNTSGTGIAVPAGKSMFVFNNGTNVVDATTYLSSLTLGAALPVTSGGTGSTSTTFVNLATNVTGTLPAGNGGTGVTSLGSGVATWLGTPSSANLASAVTDETGSGALVFGTSPTITTSTLTGYTETVVAIGTVGASHTFVISTGTVQTATLTASTPCTFTMPTATSGTSFILRLTQAATGMTTATFTGVQFAGGTAPTITATASATDIISFVAIGSTWYGSAIQNLS
jgi:hypothetical protein